MPGRGGKAGGKVAKQASASRRGSRQSSLSPGAQEQLRDLVQEAQSGNARPQLHASETTSHAPGGNGHGQYTASAFTAVNAGGASDSVESALQQALAHDAFGGPFASAPSTVDTASGSPATPPSHQQQFEQHRHQQHQQHQQHQHQHQHQHALQHQPQLQLQLPLPGQLHGHGQDHALPLAAAQAVHGAYGNAVKIDSVLCKKLAGEPALREPVQRRADQKLNMERRSNVEALLAHVTGDVAPRPCKNCHKGHGPWTQCVVYDGQMCGSCSNCWFNASGSRCTFHENNNPQPQHPFQQPPPVAGPAAAQHQHLQPQPPPPPPPVMPAPFQPQHHQDNQQPAAAPSPPAAAHHAPAGFANGVDLSHLHGNDIAQWRMADAARRAVTRGMNGLGNASRRQRLIARIEAAAKELGMRIAEYDEYMRSPEGVAEERAAQDLGDDDDAQPGQDNAGSQYSSPPAHHRRRRA